MNRARELAAETGKPWLDNPDWAGGGAQPLAEYSRLKGRTFTRGQLEAYGFQLHAPPGVTDEDLADQGFLATR